jgi:hypothetical protein
MLTVFAKNKRRTQEIIEGTQILFRKCYEASSLEFSKTTLDDQTINTISSRKGIPGKRKAD